MIYKYKDKIWYINMILYKYNNEKCDVWVTRNKSKKVDAF